MAIANSNLGFGPAPTDAATLVLSAGASFNKAVMAGTWTFADSAAAGTVTFDGMGNITGGSMTLAGSTTASSVSGTYTVNAAGKLTLDLTLTTPGSPATVTAYTLQGDINASQDVAAVDNSVIGSSANQNFGLLVSSSSNRATIGSLTAQGPVARGQPITLTANDVAIPSPGTVVSVLFYTGAGPFNLATDILLGQGTTTNAGTTWTLEAHTNRLAVGTDTFYAVAKDNLGRLSSPISTTAQITGAPPHIGSLVTVPPHPAAGNTVLFQAIGVGDADGTVASVTYYWDPSDTGTLTGDIKLGTATSGPGNWSIMAQIPLATASTPFPTSGTVTFLAVAADTAGNLSAPAILTEEVSTPPTIASLTVNPTTAGRGTIVTLTANDVTLGTGGPITHVGFWIDNLGTGVINEQEDTFVGNGVQQTGTDNWSLSYRVPASLTLTNGTDTINFLARASNGHGGLSQAVGGRLTVTAAPPVISALTVSPSTISAGEAYTLTAGGVYDPDGTAVTQVVFYSDPNDTGSITGTGVTVLGTVPVTSTTKATNVSLNLTAPSDLPTGTTLYFLAQATNALGQTSTVVASGTTTPPTIASVTASPNPAQRDRQLLLTANGVTDTGATVTQVVMYLGPIGATSFDVSMDKRLGLATQTGANTGIWTRDVILPASTPLGAYPVFAVAVNNARESSAAAMTTVTIQAAGPYTGVLSLGSKAVVAADNPVTLRVVGLHDPDGTIQSVNFYWDPTGAGTGPLSGDVLLGTSTGPKIWNLTVTLPSSTATTNPFPTSGTALFLAQAVDTNGNDGSIARYTAKVSAQPVVAALSVAPSPIDHTQPVTLTASGVTGSDSTVNRVQFWLAPAGSTTLDPIGDTLMGLGVEQSDGDWVLEVNQQGKSLQPGNFVIFVRALDNNGVWGEPLAQDVTID